VLSLSASAFYSSDSDGWIWAAVGACVGVYLFYRGFRMLQSKRLILNTPTSKIRSASMGLVEISGLTVGPYTLSAPVTGVPCYYYRTMVWQLKQSGKNREWEKVADESLHVPFYLDDNTAKLLVNPQGAEMDIHCDFREEFSGSFFSSSLDTPANVSRFLSQHGLATDKKVKVEEYCIKPKNALFVLGTLAENPGLKVAPNPVRTETPNSVTLTSGPFGMGTFSFSLKRSFVDLGGGVGAQETLREPRPARAFDMTAQSKIAAAMMKAGITNPAAWAAAGLQYPGVSVNLSGGGSAATATALAEEFDMNPKTVLMKGIHNPAFFISWRSQRDLVQSLGWKSSLMIWGGPGLTLLCVYLLAARFGWL
jgi:hypothetical protein